MRRPDDGDRPVEDDRERGGRFDPPPYDGGTAARLCPRCRRWFQGHGGCSVCA